LRCPYVAECFLYGDSLRDFNIAVIHPNPDAVLAAAQKLGIKEQSLEKLVQDKKLEQFILK